MLNKKKRHPAAYIAIAGCLAFTFLVVGLIQNRRVQALTQQVNAAYQKSFYETVALMSGIQLNLEKILVSNRRHQSEQLLATIAQQAEGAQANLAALPINSESLQGMMKFVNQVSNYSRTLVTQLKDGTPLGENDIRQLISLHDTCVTLNAEFSGLLDQYELGELVFEVPRDVGSAVRDLKEQVQPMVDYPVLLYDGPFSDARQTGVITLSGDIIDVAKAQSMLVDFVGKDRVNSVKYLGESAILDKCFEFTLQTGDGPITAGITQRGGHVVYMLPDQANTDVQLTQGECIDMALQFLKSRGYGEMEVSYWRQLGGLLTVNFAALQNRVLMYPDLVKVQISMQNGLVVGLEAANYLVNHRVRELVDPVVTREQAIEQLGAVLVAEQVRECIIPLETGEVQCWEITASMEGGNRYLIYKDVITGDERNILKVMVGDDGVLSQ